MPSSPARKRPRLASPASIGLFLGATGALLAGLLPDDSAFDRAAPSALAIPYLAARLRAQPADARLRLALARQLLAAGELESAYAALEPLLGAAAPSGRDARRLAVDARLAVWRALPPDDARRAAAAAAASEALHRALDEGEAARDLEALASIAIELGETRLAADVYARAADAEPEVRAARLAEAARWARASDDPRAAAALLDRAADAEADPAVKKALAARAIEAARAANDPAYLLALAKKYDAQPLGDDPATRDEAQRIALAAGDRAWARELEARFRLGADDDPARLLAHVDVALGDGDVDGALDLLLRYLARSPGDAAARARAAQVAEWATRSDVALAQYRWLVARGDRGAPLSRALGLAAMLHDDVALVELMLERDRARPLDQDEVILVAAKYEALGEPERASAFLGERAARAGSSVALWRALAYLEERRGALEPAIAIRRRLAALGPLAPADALEAAELVWRAGHPEEALDLLWSARARATARDTAFWDRAVDLAWQLGDEPRAQAALARLRQAKPGDVSVVERQLALARRGGDAKTMTALGLALYRMTGDPRHLVDAAETAKMDGAPARALDVLREGERDAAAGASARYWLVRGDALAALERRAEARAAYDEVLARDPSSVEAAAAAMWLAIDASDRAALAGYVARIGPRAAAAPPLYGALAAAYEVLGRPREAVAWYARQARETPRDLSLLVSYADALDRVGFVDRAARLRRHLVTAIEPSARAALRAPKSDRDATRLVEARALLARDVEGAPAGYKWLARALERADDASAEEVAIGWYLADDRLALARKWFLERHAGHPLVRARQRLAFAMAADDASMIEDALRAPGLLPEDRVGAYERLARDAEALSAADLSLRRAADADRGIVEETADLADRRAPYGRVLGAYDYLAELETYGADATAAAGVGRARLEATAGEHAIVPLGGALRPGGEVRELDARLGAAASFRAIELSGVGGVNARGASPLPYGRGSLTYKPLRFVAATLDARVDDVPDDSAFLRLAGVRDRASAELQVDATPVDYVRGTVDVFDERTLARRFVARGAGSSLEIGRRILSAAPEWRVYAAGAWTGRDVGRALPSDAAAAVSDPTAGARSVLPPWMVTAMAGTALAHGDLGRPWGRASFPRYELDVAGGWLWPVNQAVVQVRAGAGTRLLGGDQLSISGHLLTGVSGIGNEVFRGVSMGYSREL